MSGDIMWSLVRKPIIRKRRILAAGISIMLSTMLFFSVASTLQFIGESSQTYLGGESVFVLTETGSSTFRDTMLSLQLAESLKNLEGINVVSPESFYYETLQGEPVIVRAVTPTFFRLEQLSVNGRILTDSDLNTAVIGSEIAHKFHLNIGDTFLIPDPVHTSYIQFTVVGTFSGEGFIDSEIIIPLESGWLLARYPQVGKVSLIRMVVDPVVWPHYQGLYTTLKEPPRISGLHTYYADNTVITGVVEDTIGIETVEVYFKKRTEWRKRPVELTENTFTVEIPADAEEYYITAVDLFGNVTSTTIQKVTPIEVTDIVYAVTPDPPTEDDEVMIECFSDAERVFLYYTVKGPWTEVEMEKKGESLVYNVGTFKGDFLFYFLLEIDGIEYESPIYKRTIKKAESKNIIQKMFGREEKTVTQAEIMFPEGITSNFDVHSSQDFSEEVKEVGLGKLYTLTVVILLVTILATVLAIFSSVTAAVFESRREIGILLSLGSRRRVLYVIFLVNALVASFAAGVLGSFGGYGLLLLFYKYRTIVAGTILIQPVFDVSIVLFSLLFAVILGFVATYFSVRTISLMDPSKALQRVYTVSETAKTAKVVKLLPFSVKKSGIVLGVVFIMSLLLHLYPTLLTNLPFDPDSWSHYLISQKIVSTGHVLAEHPFAYVDYNTHWPGINILLAECTLLVGNPLDVTRFCIPLVSACSVILVYALAKYISQSRAAGVAAAFIFTVGGLYLNRSSSVTKEGLAFTVLLLCVYLYYVGRTKKSATILSLSFVSYLCLLYTHHISTLVYILIVLSVSVPLTMYEVYHSKYDNRIGGLDMIFMGYIIVLFYQVNMKVPIAYLQFTFSDITLLLSYLLIIGSIITYIALKGFSKKAVYISVFSVGYLSVLPYFIVLLDVYPSAPEAFLSEAPPYILWCAVGIIGLVPVLQLPMGNRLLVSGWVVAVVSFLLFALTRERSTFSFLLLFRTLSYGYQLLSILCGISLVFVMQKFYRVSKYLVVPFFLFIGILSFYSVQSGYLGNYYEQKDLYWMPEYYAGVWVDDHLCNTVLTDERLGKLLQGVAEIDYDLIAFSQVVVKGEQLSGIVVVYQDMYTHGFVADVNFIVPREGLEGVNCVYSTRVVAIYEPVYI